MLMMPPNNEKPIRPDAGPLTPAGHSGEVGTAAALSVDTIA